MVMLFTAVIATIFIFISDKQTTKMKKNVENFERSDEREKKKRRCVYTLYLVQDSV